MPGHKRSRALWDEARSPMAPKTAILRAVLYELQPIRLSSIDLDALFAWCASVRRGTVRLATVTLPDLSKQSYRVLVQDMSRRHWMIVLAIVTYYYIVRYMHRVMDAGPLVMILTALVAIFTIGLGDNQDGLSAYSVFNRGFHRLLGDLDADALVQQHVGGAMMMAGVGMAAAPPRDDGNVNRRHEERQRRREDPVDRPRQHGNAQENGDRGDDDDDTMLQNSDNDEPQQRDRARRSGKKARRRDLEQRREIQRQRQAAMDMGFAGDGGHEEMLAMQRLLEEQIVAANNQ